MAAITEGMHEGEFIGELAMGIGYHVDEGTLSSGNKLIAGAVVSTVSNEFVEFDGAADTGAEDATGILVAACDATSADAPCRVLVRGPAIVNMNDLVFASDQTNNHKAAALSALLALGIKAA